MSRRNSRPLNRTVSLANHNERTTVPVVSVRTHDDDTHDQMRMLVSSPAVASNKPDGEHATAVMPAVCPFSVTRGVSRSARAPRCPPMADWSRGGDADRTRGCPAVRDGG